MEKNSKPLIRPIPKKLARMRRVREALHGSLREAMDRYKRLVDDRRRFRHEIQQIQSVELSWPDSSKERERHQAELRKVQEALAHIEDLIADCESEKAEIKAEFNPVAQTVEQLEKHLGIDREDQYMRDRYRVSGLGGAL